MLKGKGRQLGPVHYLSASQYRCSSNYYLLFFWGDCKCIPNISCHLAFRRKCFQGKAVTLCVPVLASNTLLILSQINNTFKTPKHCRWFGKHPEPHQKSQNLNPFHSHHNHYFQSNVLPFRWTHSGVSMRDAHISPRRIISIMQVIHSLQDIHELKVKSQIFATMGMFQLLLTCKL